MRPELAIPTLAVCAPPTELKAHKPGPYTKQKPGGDGRDRTGGLDVANVTLSQLSYTPNNTLY